MKGYTKFGYTQLKDSDFKGMSKNKLEQRFKYLPEEVVNLIVKEYAPSNKKENA